MPVFSETNAGAVNVFASAPSKLHFGLSSPRKKTRRNQTDNETFTIASKVVDDRLRCMLRHIQSGDCNQVLLHTLAITALIPAAARAEGVRDLIQQAHGLFIRGASRLAEQRIREALRAC